MAESNNKIVFSFDIKNQELFGRAIDDLVKSLSRLDEVTKTISTSASKEFFKSFSQFKELEDAKKNINELGKAISDFNQTLSLKSINYLQETVVSQMTKNLQAMKDELSSAKEELEKFDKYIEMRKTKGADIGMISNLELKRAEAAIQYTAKAAEVAKAQSLIEGKDVSAEEPKREAQRIGGAIGGREFGIRDLLSMIPFGNLILRGLSSPIGAAVAGLTAAHYAWGEEAESRRAAESFYFHQRPIIEAREGDISRQVTRQRMEDQGIIAGGFYTKNAMDTFLSAAKFFTYRVWGSIADTPGETADEYARRKLMESEEERVLRRTPYMSMASRGITDFQRQYLEESRAVGAPEAALKALGMAGIDYRDPMAAAAIRSAARFARRGISEQDASLLALGRDYGATANFITQSIRTGDTARAAEDSKFVLGAAGLVFGESYFQRQMLFDVIANTMAQTPGASVSDVGARFAGFVGLQSFSPAVQKVGEAEWDEAKIRAGTAIIEQTKTPGTLQNRLIVSTLMRKGIPFDVASWAAYQGIEREDVQKVLKEYAKKQNIDIGDVSSDISRAKTKLYEQTIGVFKNKNLDEVIRDVAPHLATKEQIIATGGERGAVAGEAAQAALKYGFPEVDRPSAAVPQPSVKTIPDEIARGEAAKVAEAISLAGRELAEISKQLGDQSVYYVKAISDAFADGLRQMKKIADENLKSYEEGKRKQEEFTKKIETGAYTGPAMRKYDY